MIVLLFKSSCEILCGEMNCEKFVICDSVKKVNEQCFAISCVLCLAGEFGRLAAIAVGI